MEREMQKPATFAVFKRRNWRREEKFIAQLREALVKLICKHNQKEIAVEAMLETKENKFKLESKWE